MDIEDKFLKFKLSNERGVAMAFSLLLIVVLVSVAYSLIQMTIVETKTTQSTIKSTQAFYIAEGGAYTALKAIDTGINTYMKNNIKSTLSSQVASDAQLYCDTKDGLDLLLKYVRVDMGSPLLNAVYPPGKGSTNSIPIQLTYTGTIDNLGTGTYQYTIIFTQKSDPVKISAAKWHYFFNYSIVSTGMTTQMNKKTVLTGDFTVEVGSDSLARYALAVNDTFLVPYLEADYPQHWMIGGTYRGPLHTNEHFHFMGNYGGTPTNSVYNDVVTQSDQEGCFSNNGPWICIDADSNPPFDVPVFNNGFVRGAPAVDIAGLATQQNTVVDASRGTMAVPGSNEIYVPNDGTNLTGGIYVKGDSAITMSVVDDKAVYNIVTTTPTGPVNKIITVDIPQNRTTVEIVSGSTAVYQGLPDGVDHMGTIIHVDGKITDFSGTVQKDTAITVSSASNIIISNDVMYSDYQSGQIVGGTYIPPSAEGTQNMLGLISWEGSILIDTNAPNNLQLHGILTAPQNIISTTEEFYSCAVLGNCSSWENSPDKGVLTHLGGQIGADWLEWGLKGYAVGSVFKGYAADNVFDKRTAQGIYPPYYPTGNGFIASSSDIFDKPTWQDTEF